MTQRHDFGNKVGEMFFKVFCILPFDLEIFVQVRVVVVGAGIIGLPTAVNILEKVGNTDVTIVSEELTPNTTGDGAAGVWEPYLTGNTPEHLQKYTK